MPSSDIQKAEAGVSKIASGFADALRKNGVNIGIFDLLTYIKALGTLGIQSRKNTYWAGRISLINNPVEIPVYDETFEAYWTPFDKQAGSSLDDEYSDEENTGQDETDQPAGEPSLDLADLESDSSFTTVPLQFYRNPCPKRIRQVLHQKKLAEAKKAISKIRVSIPQRTFSPTPAWEIPDQPPEYAPNCQKSAWDPG